MEMDRLRVFVYEFLCECGLLALFTLYPLFLSSIICCLAVVHLHLEVLGVGGVLIVVSVFEGSAFLVQLHHIALLPLLLLVLLWRNLHPVEQFLQPLSEIIFVGSLRWLVRRCGGQAQVDGLGRGGGPHAFRFNDLVVETGSW